MKTKSVLAILMVLGFIFFVGCKRASETQAEKVEMKATSVEQGETREAEEEGRQAKKAIDGLPAAVAQAVRDNVPHAEIGTVGLEKNGEITLFDIEFKAGMGEIEIAQDGTVMDVATIIDLKDVPAAAVEAIRKAAAGATIRQVEKSEIRAEIRKEGEATRIVKFEKPSYVYEAELAKGGQTAEVQVAPDGKIVEAPKWSPAGVGEK